MVYLVGPKIGIKYEGPDATVTASYRINREGFANHPGLDRFHQDFSVDTDIGRMLSTVLPKGSTIQVQERMIYTPILPNFQSLLTPAADVSNGGVSTGRTNTLRNVFEVNESMPISMLTRIALGYKNSYTQYQDPTLIDSQMNEARFTIRHDISRTDTTSTGYSYRRFNPYGGEVSHLHGLTVGDRHEFSPILKGEASFGVTAAVLPAFNSPKYSGHGTLSVSRQFKNRSNISLRGSRYLDAASGISGIPLITDRATISMTKDLTQALSMEADLNGARNYSIVKEAGTGRPIDIHSQGANIGLHYRLASWLMSDLEYRFYRQERMGNNQTNFTRNLYGFTLRANWN